MPYCPGLLDEVANVLQVALPLSLARVCPFTNPVTVPDSVGTVSP